MADREPIAFTIISPSLNQGPFLREMLESVAFQDYPVLQHIVVDGGSTDATLDILREYEGSYPLEWISEPDGGLYDALNKALDRARGEWVGWINCDDLYPRGVFRSVAEAIDRYPDVEVVCGDAEVFRESTEGQEVTLYVDRHKHGQRLIASTENLRLTHLNACFFKRSLLVTIGQFNVSFRIFGDRDYMFRMMSVAPRMHHVERVTYRYRSHPASLTFSNVSAKYQKPIIGDDHVLWHDIKQLCQHHLNLTDMPKGVERWCRERLGKLAARDAAASLMSRDLAGFVRDLRSGVVHHPGWVYWFVGALVRRALGGGGHKQRSRGEPQARD